MRLAEKISGSFVRQSIISAEDEGLYQFGIEQLCFQLLNLMTSAVIGLLTGKLLETLVFTAVYISLRIYAGGFHAKTQQRCYFLSTGLLIFALISMQLLPKDSLTLWLLLLPSACIIFTLSPVADFNKPLSKCEQSVYRKRAHYLLVAILLIVAGLNVVQLKALAICIGTAISTLSIMLVLGFIKNKGKRTMEEHLEGDG